MRAERTSAFLPSCGRVTRKEKRSGRVYLDIMRNTYAQKAVAPYSVRARAGAPVATSLEWDELDARGLRADRFTIRDLPKRRAGQRDPWANVSRHASSLTDPLRRLARFVPESPGDSLVSGGRQA